MRHRHPRLGAFVLLLLLALAPACGSAPETRQAPTYDREAAWKTLGLDGQPEEFEKGLEGLRDLELDPPAEVGEGYAPTFPPDLPFDAQEDGWKTAVPQDFVAEPNARRGGTLRLAIPDFPPTMRTEGPNSRLSTLSDIHNLIYETLLDYDVSRGEYLPRLATHYWVGPDRKTFRFRIDPRARWADGTPVTADDVKATLEHLRREDRKDPSVAEHYDQMIADVNVLDRLTVEVVAKEPRWMTLVDIGLGTKIYPAAYIRMDGDTYLTDWNWKLPPGSGPYSLAPEDVVKGRSITVHRRTDWWAEQDPSSRGMYNFESVRWDIILDDELTYLKFLAGELDAMMIMRAQQWVDDVDRAPPVRMGWVQKRKIYTMEPQGYGGYCFNMRSAPFNDRNVREAFAHLFNREKLFEKFFFYQYEYIDSYFPGQIYSRENAERVQFDPRRARELLAASGWTRRDSEGYLVNDRGQRFPVLTLEFASPSFQRIHQVVKDDLWRQAGIRMDLKVVDQASLLKKVWEYKYTVTFFNWTASLFPDMEMQFHSKHANVPQTNNLNGFRNERADRIMEAYKTEFDAARRLEMMQELDTILFREHPYALGWYAPYFRILYWDHFGHPPEYTDRFTASLNAIIKYWWFDPEKRRHTEENRTTNQPNYPDRPLHQSDAVEHRYWIENETPMKEDDR